MRKLKNITVVLIDDNSTYRYLLSKRLSEVGVDMVDSIDTKHMDVLGGTRAPGLAFMSYGESLSNTCEMIDFVRSKLPGVKIIIAVAQEDKITVPIVQLQKAGIDGLIYKADISIQELYAVVKSVNSGKKYFQNPNKTFP